MFFCLKRSKELGLLMRNALEFYLGICAWLAGDPPSPNILYNQASPDPNVAPYLILAGSITVVHIQYLHQLPVTFPHQVQASDTFLVYTTVTFETLPTNGVCWSLQHTATAKRFTAQSPNSGGTTCNYSTWLWLLCSHSPILKTSSRQMWALKKSLTHSILCYLKFRLKYSYLHYFEL